MDINKDVLKRATPEHLEDAISYGPPQFAKTLQALPFCIRKNGTQNGTGVGLFATRDFKDEDVKHDSAQQGRVYQERPLLTFSSVFEFKRFLRSQS